VKFLFFIFFYFFIANAKALEVGCDFEEVYDDGTIQQGTFLIMENKLRYEYNNSQLFTLFYFEGEVYLVRNDNPSLIQKISEETPIIDSIMQVIEEYPNIKNYYEFDQIKIKLEKSLATDFIKRLSIASKDINLSIYLNDCIFKSFPRVYFNFNPIVPYKK